MIKLKDGILISIEGVDGSGKSTLAHNLKQSLMKHNVPVVLTKEPGGSTLSTQLREILQTQPTPLESKAEFLLFAADRAQHFHDVILPNVQQNKIVISDRMADSSVVYQGYGRGLDIQMIRTINNWAMQCTHPDITFYIKIPLIVAKQRIAQRKELSVFEKKDEHFLKKLIDGFDTIFKDKKHAILLDGTQDQETLTNQATEIIMQWIQQHKT